ncbi:Homoserine dehydrogenase [Clostridium liquoris]|jgi:homoserine dehydrogenase|uniref:Homoserine dehydrogenase n=1 Tax=Clostridium liquoris TaxID=1289519 RepID=A0A2T0B8B4_9CLOT|nr:homoserine dehydrogenase [Clostridium liquoris]PRR80102.1 Homoserine dehydrogenase [Clostridium liquoris]
MKKKLVLSGFGKVGREFVKLIYERRQYIKNEYDVDLILCGVIGRLGCIFEDEGLDLQTLLKCKSGSSGILQYGEINKDSFYDYPVFEGDILVECTNSDINTGGMALNYILNAIERGMDVVIVSKGALVTNFHDIINKARKKNVKLKYSGATAAALPTMDVGYYSLAGSKINSIIGILNGTTNYILTKMFEHNISFNQALEEAIDKGITERENSMDIDGIDSGCKILLLSNSFMKTEYKLNQVSIKGIRNIEVEDIKKAKDEGKVIKLLSKAYFKDDKVVLEVGLEKIRKDHILASIKGTNKGAIFNTDTMGEICIFGGASNPRGAAAAAIKDVINICRQ